MDKIDYIIDSREERESGLVKMTVRLIGSNVSDKQVQPTRDQRALTTNEIPILLNTLKRSEALIDGWHYGFTYVLDYPLEEGKGMPYLFDVEMS